MCGGMTMRSRRIPWRWYCVGIGVHRQQAIRLQSDCNLRYLEQNSEKLAWIIPNSLTCFHKSGLSKDSLAAVSIDIMRPILQLQPIFETLEIGY